MGLGRETSRYLMVINLQAISEWSKRYLDGLEIFLSSVTLIISYFVTSKNKYVCQVL